MYVGGSGWWWLSREDCYSYDPYLPPRAFLHSGQPKIIITIMMMMMSALTL